MRALLNKVPVPAWMGLLELLIHLPVLGRYAYHQDELYFVACGQRLSFGYVDHAPLVPWITRLWTLLLGDSLVAVRLLPALAGALAVVLTGQLARSLGGGRFAQLVACLAIVVAPGFMRGTSVLSLPAFEPLFWLGGALLLVRIVRDDDHRSWLWLGLVIGLGLQTKHTMGLFCLGLAVGTLATPLRRQLRTPWPWAGALVALLVFLPNVVWQAQHDWPTLGFIAKLYDSELQQRSRVAFVVDQFVHLNPFAVLIWTGGLAYLFSWRGRRYRALAWIWTSTFAVLLAAHGKNYYLAAAHPLLMAAGGVASERWLGTPRGRRFTKAMVAAMVVSGALFVPAALPYLPLEQTAAYLERLGLGLVVDTRSLMETPRAMLDWPGRVEGVAAFYQTLPPSTQERSMLLASGYGAAGAIDVLGRPLGLPPAVSFAQSYWIWGYPDRPIDTVIGVGHDPRFLRQIWNRVEIVRQLEPLHGSPFVVTVCEDPKVPLEVVWRDLRPW